MTACGDGDDNQACGAGTVSVAGQCRPSCARDDECAANERCELSIGVCVEAVGEDAEVVDVGGEADAGGDRDAGGEADATPRDAEQDAGAMADAEVPTDAAPSDAGHPEDATPGDADPADVADTDPPDLGPPDAGQIADTGPPDVGQSPPSCQRDQECPLTMVCDLSVVDGRCVPGRPCQRDVDCAGCFDITGSSIDCGHGFHVRSYCGAANGSVCTRMLSPCEPCVNDSECGSIHPLLGGGRNRCLSFANGRYCGRASTMGCPPGYTVGASGQCERPSGCPAQREICPAGSAQQACTGTDQICAGQRCPNRALCQLNDSPGFVGFCSELCATNADCPTNRPVCNPISGVCIAGCARGACPGTGVCHSDGTCGAPCARDSDCAQMSGVQYCNLPGRTGSRVFKPYRDTNSCAPLGCEENTDCGSAGRVCNLLIDPPLCVGGCYEDAHCPSDNECRRPGAAGVQPSYTVAECRALAPQAGSSLLGVCCNPGCRDATLQCDVNQWCCGQVGAPFEDPSSCFGADEGECFDIAPPPATPFCNQCNSDMDCDSGWMFGFNSDPNINAGQPFQEDEQCVPVFMGLSMCGVTCNPALPRDGSVGCPRGWNCQAVTPQCFQDADCSGLPCAGADSTQVPPVPGRCSCGVNGTPFTQCPSAYALFPSAVTHPRCVELGGGDMFCTASFSCVPPPLLMTPGGGTNYPVACTQ